MSYTHEPHSWGDDNLATLDLNLLKALDALLRTESVSRSAQRLNVTQSAVSHALKRLRDIFGDPLLVRDGGGVMRATARAMALREPLERAMADIEGLLASARAFDPANSQRVFRLAMSDAMTVEGLPSIVQLIRREAPNVDVLVETGGPVHSCRLLIEEQADRRSAFFPRCRTACAARNCIAISWSASRTAPTLGEERQAYAAGVSRMPARDGGAEQRSAIEVDDILRAMGMTRRIVASVPHYLAIPSLISGTDLVAHSRRKLIDVFRSASGLVVMPVPVPFPVPEPCSCKSGTRAPSSIRRRSGSATSSAAHSQAA